MSATLNSTSSSATTNKIRIKFKLPRWAKVLAVVLIAGVITIGAVAGVAYATQKQTIVRGVTVGGLSVGRLDTLTALKEVEKSWLVFSANAFTFQAGDTTIKIPAGTTAATTEELIVDVADFEPAAAVNSAYDFGHRGSGWRQLWERTSGYLGRRHEFGLFSLSLENLADALRQQTATITEPTKNAGFEVSKDGAVTITPSVTGKSFDYNGAAKTAHARLRSLDSAPIIMTAITTQPEIVSAAELKTIATAELPAILDRAPLTITDNDQKWELKRGDLEKLLGFVRKNNGIHVGFDTVKTSAYLEELRPKIDVVPQNAKFSLTSGKVKEFQTSVVGRSLDVPNSLAAMEAKLIDKKESTAELVVMETEPATNQVAPNQLGIKELVAEASTNFRGSPTNRRFNINYGAKILNGLLIKPDDEFSLVKALGVIDAAHGWKSELVIKGTRIKPEYGGGLCQVGTTMFRVILDAGLPVLERSNHSLRISYYEPPIGLDATIYEPKPDLRFKNDYANYLLLQTEVSGDNLIFRFYGTTDGRTVDLPTPKVYNRTPIPPTTTVEVDDLKPGVKECQAPGHPGADATATYTVTKSDGTKTTQTFQSHYRAIGIICRVGKTPAAKPKTTNTNTNKNTNSSTNTNAATTNTNQ